MVDDDIVRYRIHSYTLLLVSSNFPRCLTANVMRKYWKLYFRNPTLIIGRLQLDLIATIRFTKLLFLCALRGVCYCFISFLSSLIITRKGNTIDIIELRIISIHEKEKTMIDMKCIVLETINRLEEIEIVFHKRMNK